MKYLKNIWLVLLCGCVGNAFAMEQNGKGVSLYQQYAPYLSYLGYGGAGAALGGGLAHAASYWRPEYIQALQAGGYRVPIALVGAGVGAGLGAGYSWWQQYQQEQERRQFCDDAQKIVASTITYNFVPNKNKDVDKVFVKLTPKQSNLLPQKVQALEAPLKRHLSFDNNGFVTMDSLKKFVEKCNQYRCFEEDNREKLEQFVLDAFKGYKDRSDLEKRFDIKFGDHDKDIWNFIFEDAKNLLNLAKYTEQNIRYRVGTQSGFYEKKGLAYGTKPDLVEIYSKVSDRTLHLPDKFYEALRVLADKIKQYKSHAGQNELGELRELAKTMISALKDGNFIDKDGKYSYARSQDKVSIEDLLDMALKGPKGKEEVKKEDDKEKD